MEKLLKVLYNILENEYDYYLDLNEFAAAKKKAIIDNDVEGLSQIIVEEKELIAELNQLETERDDILDKLKHDISESEAALNFNQLVASVSDSWSDKFKKIRDKLLQTIDELHQKNESNKLLINEAIKMNKFSYQMIARVVDPTNNTYNKDDDSTENSARHFMDRRA